MSHIDDQQNMTATRAINDLQNIGHGTDIIEHHLERWNRVRDASRNARTPDATTLWAAIADGDTKATQKAAQEYMVARAILDAAKADTRREDVFRAATLSAVKDTVRDALPTARTMFNEAASEYSTAFTEAGNHPEPAQLIVTENGADLWADLISSANAMNAAAAVIRLGHEFGFKVNDQGTGLIKQVPYATGLPTITAYEEAKAQHTFLSSKEHAPHREWALFLLAGGELYAGDINEQRAEVERLIEQAQDGRKQKMIPDMINNEQRALKRAMKAAQKRGDA
jgi:hypothetical protein